MTKGNVRKGIVEGILAKLVAGASGGGFHSPTNSEGGAGDGKAGYVPPSLALQGKKPPSSGAPSAMQRSASQPALTRGGQRDISRPPSRAAGELAEVPPEGAGGGNAEVKAVYVRGCTFLFLMLRLNLRSRSRRQGIWSTSSLLWEVILRYEFLPLLFGYV